MASVHDEKAPAGRLVLLGSLLILAVISAAGFARVFQGRTAAGRLILAAAVSVLLAGALERRHILLAAIVSAAGLAVAIGILVFPETVKFGLPTPTTLRSVQAALRAVGHTAQVQVAPALPLDPLMLAALTAVWTAAFASHALAARARSPFLAILPLAALLAFAGVLVEDGARPVYTVVFLAASLALLFADGFRRVGHWGPITIWHSRSRFGLGAASTSRAARRVAMACLGVAAFTPWILPGLHAQGLLDVHGRNAESFVSINPIVDIRPALVDNKPIELFRVASPRPAYWRFLSLDEFNGRLWKSSNLDAGAGPLIATGPLTPNAAEPVGLLAPDVTHLHQRFDLERLTQPWLPAAFDPVGVAVRGSVVRYEPEGQVLVAPSGSYHGYSYDVDSELVVPKPDELDALSVPVGPDTQRYTELPSGLPPQIAAIAHRWTDNQPTMYRKVLAIQDRLLRFRYDIRVPAGHSSNEILHFLTVAKAGYCEQFAGSMAVLLRALGIPARVALGFTPGTFDAARGQWVVTSQNAHAWVEVLFPRFGWLPFEPTPTRSNPVAVPYTAFTATPLGGQQGCEVPGQCGRGGRSTRGTQLEPGINNRPRVGHDEGIPASSGGGTFAVPGEASPSYRGRVLLALLGLALLFALCIPLVKAARRRMTLRGARDPRGRVLASFQILTEQAADLRLGRRPNETPDEYRARLSRAVPSLDGPLAMLTRLTTEAAYSDRGFSQGQAEEASRSARSVIREIRGTVGTAVRLLGLFRIERYSLAR